MRLIDEDALNRQLAQEFADSVIQGMSNEYREGLIMANTYVNALPTIDAEPVRHGRWVRDTGDTPDIWFCTACKYCIAWRPNYCPNCGAKMDGGKNNAEQ